jgi:ABC-type Mn2+/Zn2+ transport system ATPase subunit
MTSRGYAQWIRADVHVHTPFDRTKSFGVNTNAALTAQKRGDDKAMRDIASAYYQSCRDAGLSMVGVTDHNACDGHKFLKRYLDELNCKAIAGGEGAILFLPGVEITVGSERPVHVLLLFDESASYDEINGCISNVFRVSELFNGATGDPAAANCTVPDFLAQVRGYCRPATGERCLGYIVIPAHVEGNRGIVREIRGSLRRLVIQHQDWNGFQSNGAYVEQSRDFQEMLAEWVATRRGRNWSNLDRHGKDEFRKAKHWALVQASDPAKYREIGSKFTWLKMEEPSLEGLRLALLDPESRLRSSDDGCPACEYPHITGIRIQNSVLFEDISLPVSPQLNTLIGGRGTGKTTVLEYVRHCLDRVRIEDFVGGTEEVRKELIGFLSTKPDRASEKPGTLLDDYRVTLCLRIAGSDYEVQREASGLRVLKDGHKVDPTRVDIRALVEPTIMSQRQMAAIARDSEAQRLVLDSLVPPRVRHDCTDARDSATDGLEDAQRDRDRLIGKITDLPTLRTQLLRLDGHIEALKAPGCEETLEQKEQTAVAEAWLDKARETLSKVSRDIAVTAEDIKNTLESLPSLDCEEGSWLERIRDGIVSSIENTRDALLAAAATPETMASTLHAERETEWKPQAEKAKKAYDDLAKELSQRGVDLSKRSELNDQRRTVHERVDELAREAKGLENKKTAVSDARKKLISAAKKMTAARRTVVTVLAEEQSDIHVEIHEMRDRRGLLGQREAWFAGTGMQARDWETVVDYVMRAKSVSDCLRGVIEALRRDHAQASSGGAALAEDTSALATMPGMGTLTGHFYSAVGRLAAETLNQMERYVPEDLIETKFRDNDGVMKPLENASLGQKSTAILALLLTAGTQPLVIDQPEDDIDNRYVYDVLVGLLRHRKFQRQIIVASHNANIPVNGDAEMIAGLCVEGGRGRLKDCGSIDSLKVKELVNDVMEGSREAFMLRRERYGF